MTMLDLFDSEATDEAKVSKQLPKTVELTMISSELVATVLQKIKSSDADDVEFKQAVQDSMTSHAASDALLDSLITWDEVDRSSIGGMAAADVNGMLKSQQSKRSKSKSGQMSVVKYRAMLTAAVAERLLRLEYNKPKGSTGSFGGAKRAGIGYSEEELQQLTVDQHALRAAIRNVQSKKSIEKKKESFDPEGERWLEINDTLAQLIALRVDGEGTRPKVIDQTRNNLLELLDDTTDLSKLKAADAKELLTKIQELIANS